MVAPQERKHEKRRRRQLASTAALQIVQAATREDVGMAELGTLATSDPAFAIRILSLVNSPGFALASKVTDVNQAVSLLGIRGLRNLALSLAVSDMAPTHADAQVLLANSIRRAVTCKLLAQALGEREADSYFTVGLFLEAGLLVGAEDNLEEAVRIANSPALSRVVLERATWQSDHPSEGAMLAEAFSLPSEMVDAIRHHHDSEAPASRLARVAWTAERIAAVFEGGATGQNKQLALDSMHALELDEAALDRLLEDLPSLVTRAAAGFRRDIPDQHQLNAILADANRTLIELNSQYDEMVRQLQRTLAEKEALAQQLKEANAQLNQLARTDTLTGLPNKRAFEETLTQELIRCKRNQHSIGILIMDVDHFKKFNDTYGHQTGDVVLKAVGSVLQKWLRASDFPARYGGEEFIAVLPNINPTGAKIVGERLRKKLESHEVVTEHGTLSVTASFGIAIEDENFDAGDELIGRADAALYQSKEAGRNCVTIG